jgi:uncharacterized membrane protein YeiH
MDAFGAPFLAFVASVAGGVLRDLLIGARMALDAGLTPLMAAVLGMLTATGIRLLALNLDWHPPKGREG